MIGPDETFGEVPALTPEQAIDILNEMMVLESQKQAAAIEILRSYIDNRLSLEQVGILATELLAGEE